jgi:ribosomal protein S12 methylthiotransferase accessory factor
MNVRLVGEGPAIEAARAMLADTDLTVEAGTPADVTDADFALVSGLPGDDRLTATNDAAGETPWIAVEVGGLGGQSLDAVDAGITAFGEACYDCLQTRVEANDSVLSTDPSADRAAVRLAGSIAGREAIRALTGEADVLDTVTEVPHARRPLLPVPGCCASRQDTALTHQYVDRSIEDTVGRAERAVDERLGPVSVVGEAESFPAPYYLATMAATDAFSDTAVPQQAAGVHEDWDAAYVKAVGEGLERYGSSVYREEDLRTAAPSDLDAVVPPATFAAADDEAPDADSDESRQWLRGERLPDGESTWLPAEAVLFPPPSSPDMPSITTGLGLGSSPIGAVLSGLTEVIERDATMLSWYSTVEPLGLSVDDERFTRLERRAKSEDLQVTPLLVTQDIDVPVVTVAVHRDTQWPRFAVGSAAALDPVAAASSALTEAIQNWMELRSVGEAEADSLDGELAHYATFPITAQEFVEVETTVPAASVGPEDVPTGEAALETLCARLEEADLTAYATNLTTGDLDELGFAVARTLVPGAQPLFTDSPHFGDRILSVPEALDGESRREREHHPYP